MRSVDTGNKSIPATANSVSGNTSVTRRSACSAVLSSSEPGTAAASAVKFSWSEIRKIARIAMMRIDACNRTPAPSKATEPIAASVEVSLRTIMSAPKAATNEKSEMKSCEEWRAARGAKASISTPISAPANTIRIGARCE